jgi:hypothetical protein
MCVGATQAGFVIARFLVPPRLPSGWPALMLVHPSPKPVTRVHAAACALKGRSSHYFTKLRPLCNCDFIFRMASITTHASLLDARSQTETASCSVDVRGPMREAGLVQPQCRCISRNTKEVPLGQLRNPENKPKLARF